jgi:prevent-host-death family protein
MDTFNIHAAKTQLSRLVSRAEAGEEVVIARAGKPVAKIVPIPPHQPARKLGLMKGRIWISPDFDDPLPAELFDTPLLPPTRKKRRRKK